MRITKLEIRGFKSFRDKTILKFPDQFTPILGPNGSGKSNVVDAICFVLGKSSGLRESRLTELIYNGGVGKKPSKYSEISLYLGGSNEKEKKISRMIDEKGVSIYSLNNKRTIRQEIIDLVGDNEYNIIFQADAAQVIDMTPKQKKESTEGLCDIAEYDKKKDNALRELEKVESHISDKYIILGEKKGYPMDLETKKEDALKYKTSQAKLESINAVIFSQEIKEL